MARGGSRAGAGRKPGSSNKLTVVENRTLTEIAREYTSGAVSTLATIMEDSSAPAAARITAANSLLERGWGKPVMPIEHTGKDEGPVQFEKVSARDTFISRMGQLAARGDQASSAGKPN